MTILGLDLGTKRIGVARSDEAGFMAHGVGCMESRSQAENIKDVLGFIDEYDAEAVIIGHPVNMDGSLGGQAKAAASFAEALRKATSVTVKLWDERLSTQEAERYLREGHRSRKKRKRQVDKLAAQIILQSYMDAQRHPGD